MTNLLDFSKSRAETIKEIYKPIMKNNPYLLIIDEDYAICKNCTRIKSLKQAIKKKENYMYVCDFTSLLKYKRV